MPPSCVRAASITNSSGSKAAGPAPRRLRAASLAPLALATPLAAVLVGAVPDPFAGGSLYLQLVVVGWLACSLPSPQDFSLVWHANRVLEGGL